MDTERKRVVLDGRGIAQELDGIGRYSLNLARELIRLDPRTEYLMLVRHEAVPRVREWLGGGPRLVPVAEGHMSVPGMLRLGRMVDRLGADLYHGMMAFHPLVMRTPGIVTIPDAMWLNQPAVQAGGRLLRMAAGWLFHEVFVGAGARVARRVVTISEAARTELLAWWPWLRDKIEVIPCGVDDRFATPVAPERAASLLEQHGLAGRRFFVHPTNGKAYKNTPRVVESFGRICRDTDTYLALVGRQAGEWERLQAQVRRAGLADRVLALGNVDDEALVALMHHAVGLVFPSLVEGFGLPIVEAMQAGTAVVTSNRSSMPEVAGDAALLVDPESTAAIAAAMRRLSDDAPLRERLIASGSQRAARYSWERVARDVLALHERMG